MKNANANANTPKAAKPKTTPKVEKQPLSTEEKEAAAKKLARQERKKEMKAAKLLVKTYTETKDFKGLPEDIQGALIRITATAKAGSGSRVTLVEEFKKLFPKVGTSINELDVFKQTKMGRGEMKKKIRYCLKTAAPKERMWITFNLKNEEWTLDGIGGDANPKSTIPGAK